MRLGELAAVRSGLVLSRKQSREPSKYRYPLINLRSVNPGGYIDIANTDLYDAIEPLNPEYLSHIGDVVIRLSAPYTAVLIDSETSDMVISSNFAVVRPDSGLLISEYLFWLLNTPKIKHRIYENTSSNMLGAIKPRYFSDLDIQLLPLESQRKIADINQLARRECRLLKELADEKEKFYSDAINQIQKHMRRGINYDDQK